MCRDLWNWQLRNPKGIEGPYIAGDLAEAGAKTKAIIQETRAAESTKELPPLPPQATMTNGANGVSAA